VTVLHSLQDHLEVCLDVSVRERLVLRGQTAQQLLQIARHVLEHEIDVAVVVEYVHQLEHVGVVQLLQQLDLAAIRSHEEKAQGTCGR